MFVSRNVNHKLKLKYNHLRKGLKFCYSQINQKVISLNLHKDIYNCSSSGEFDQLANNNWIKYYKMKKSAEEHMSSSEIEMFDQKMNKIQNRLNGQIDLYEKNQISKDNFEAFMNKLNEQLKTYFVGVFETCDNVSSSTMYDIHNLNYLLVDMDQKEPLEPLIAEESEISDLDIINLDKKIIDDLRKPFNGSSYKKRFEKYRTDTKDESYMEVVLTAENENTTIEDVFEKDNLVLTNDYFHDIGVNKEEMTREQNILKLGADEVLTNNESQFNQFTFSLINDMSRLKNGQNGSKDMQIIENQKPNKIDTSKFKDLKDFTKFENIKVGTVVPDNQLVENALNFGNKINYMTTIKHVETKHNNNDIIKSNEVSISNIKLTYESYHQINNSLNVQSDNYSENFDENYQHQLKTSKFTYLNAGQPKNVKSNWIYVYNLPYDFDRKEMNQDLHLAFEKYGEIEKIELIRFSDLQMIDFSKDQSEFDGANMISNFKSNKTTQEDLGNKDQLDNGLLAKFNIYDPESGEYNIDKKKGFIDDVEKKLITRKFIKAQKSYAFVKFRNRDSKTSLLNSNIVLFGVSISKKFQIMIEDADYKKSLKFLKIPWNISLFNFVNFLNFHFRSNNLSEIKLEENLKGLVVSDENFYIKFPCLQEALIASFLINHLQFDGEDVSVIFIPGKVKFIEGEKQERINYIEDVEVFEKIEKQNFETKNNLKSQNDIDYLERGLSSYKERVEIDKEVIIDELYSSHKNNFSFLNNVDRDFIINNMHEEDDHQLKEDKIHHNHKQLIQSALDNYF